MLCKYLCLCWGDRVQRVLLMMLVLSFVAGSAMAVSEQDEGILAKFSYPAQISFSLNLPTFGEKLQHYEELYGKANLYPSMMIRSYFRYGFWALGWSLGAGWYYDDGYAATVNAGKVEAQKIEGTVLLLVPVRGLLTASIRPIGRWLYFDFAAGGEYLYAQEERVSQDSSDPFFNSSWRPYWLLSSGIALSLLFLDGGASANSLQRSHDINNVLLHARWEMTLPLADTENKADFSRTQIVMGLTFEKG